MSIFNGFSNKELIHIYFQAKDHTDSVDKIIEKGYISKSMGPMVMVAKLDNSAKEELQSIVYKRACIIKNKLQNIIDLLEGEDSYKETFAFYNNIGDKLNENSIDLTDDPKET